MKNRISAIAAIGQNRELGKQNKLIWRIPNDLLRLRALTTDHPIIMGRNTFVSIGRPLPERTNIVVSKTLVINTGYVVCRNLPTALAYADNCNTGEIFIFGGAQIYASALPHVQRLYLTILDTTEPEADTFFPDYSAFESVHESPRYIFEDISYRYVTLDRK